MTVHYFTHIGQERFGHNQDAILIAGELHCDRSFVTVERSTLDEKSPYLFAVADGVSTHPKSHLASCKVLQYLYELWQNRQSFSPVTLLKQIQERFSNESLSRRDLHGASTTVAGVYLQDVRAKIFHVGDSRVYRLRNGRLERLTRDHTQLESMREDGEINDDEYRNAANVYHVLESYLVFGELDPNETRIDTKTVDLIKDDALLIVTDGVTNTIDDEKIEALLSNGENLENAAQRLKDAVLESTDDNFSFVLVEL